MMRPSSISTLSPGCEIGGCRIIRRIGKGGMGEVYLAEHLALQRPVAVKILPPDWGGQERVQRFIREARTCSRIDHPHVVTIHDVGSQRGLHYIIMQYVAGKNLAQLVKEQGGPLPWRPASLLVRQAAKGLAAVHQNGLIHRDVKPANIMLTSDGRVLLMDFGLVRDEAETQWTQTNKIVGSPAYMSPEQCTGKRLDPRTDIFSLGSTFYYLLTARPPFTGNLNETLAKIASGTRPEPAHERNPLVPPEISVIVSRAMATRPADRFADAKSMAKALGQVVKRKPRSVSRRVGTPEQGQEPEPVELVPELELLVAAPAESAAERRRSKRAWIYGGTLVAALLLVGLVLNLAIPPATFTDGPVVDKTAMVYIEPGYVQMGNRREDVVEHLQQMLSGVVPEEALTELKNNPQQMQLLSLLVDQFLEAERRVFVRGFWIDQYEVTNAQYAKFIQATGWEPPEDWNGTDPPQGKEQHPVENVRYRDAEAYARWAHKRLPTSEQWTRAYRGDNDWLFPWGDNYKLIAANVLENTGGSTTPVSATPEDVSLFKVYNLVGNVCEYVRGRTTVAGEPAVMIKGASYKMVGFGDGIGGVRQIIPSGLTQRGIGFRCVAEEPPK